MGLTLLPSDPFYEGTPVAVPGVPYTMPISIGDHSYLIEVAQYRRGVVEQLRQPTDQGEEPGEQSFNTQGLWKRSQSDFSLGTGQDFFDDPRSSSRRRFRSSLGVDPWTKYQLSLLPVVEAKTGGPTTNATLMQSLGTRLYVAGGSNLYFTSDPTPAGPTWSTIAVGSPVLDFTTDGTYVYIATAAGLYRVTLGSTTLGAVWAAGSFTSVRYANGRLLVASATVLSEVTAAATLTTIKTLTFTGYVWVGIAAAPSGIYAWASSNDATEIYYIGVVDATGALAVPVFAGALPVGETLNVMEFYGGVLILGTTIGLRLATIGDGGGLAYGPAIEVGSVRDLDQRGKFCWFTWSNFVEPLGTTHTGLGRANLAEWTEEMVPAYATDLMATGSGVAQAVAWLGGRHYFTVVGTGLYGEDTDLVAEGHFYSGFIRYGNFERKIISSLDVRTAPLEGSIELHLHLENDEHLQLATFDTADALGPSSPAVAFGADGESVEVHLMLMRDGSDVTAGPTLQRWTVRALPAPNTVEEFILPLIVADRVKNDRGVRSFYTPLEEYEYLLGLLNSKSTVRYQEGTSSYTVYVSRVEVQPDSWNDSVQFFEGLIVVRLVTIQPNG